MSGYSFYRDDQRLPPRRGFISYFFIGIIGAIIGGALLLTFAPAALLEKVVPKENKSEDTPKKEEQAAAPAAVDGELTAAIAKKVMPSVVGIKAIKVNETMDPEKAQTSGIWSGVIVSGEGYIISNYHVEMENSSDIMVYLSDGRVVPGSMVWEDKQNDISVLKISADNITAADMGNSDTIEVGETAIAFGSSSGLRYGRTAALGIVSGLNCSITAEGKKLMEDLIQTDASINEGSSGGPLVNCEGKIIGICTTKPGSAAGVSFAIPINSIGPVIKSFLKSGSFVTPYIGITGLDREIAGLYNYNINEGIYVAEIDTKGPAYAAGIRKDDIIIEMNNTAINTLTAMKQVLYSTGVDNTVQIKCHDRFGTVKALTVRLTKK